jgi:predicted ATPase/DNA-binding winged helix-turn-helix (wHTH) protein
MHNGTDYAAQGVITFGPFRLSVAERLIERSGEPLELGGRAMDVLIALVERAGEVVSQRDLIDRAWPNVTVDDSNLRCHVGVLRRALCDGQDGARYVINVPGRGYCFVSPTTRAPTNKATPVPNASPFRAVPVIPPRLRRMVGRDAVVEVIAAQLAGQRFVTIVGPGGIGKTTVAISVGHALAAGCGTVCFVDLGPLTNPRLVPSQLASTLGLVVQSDNLIPSLIGFLRDKRMLLILDSCEHVIETVAGLAEAIFAQAEGVHILATSREALRIEGEYVYRLAPLDCPPASDTLTAAEALAFPAAQLFSDRVAANSGRFALQDADAPAVARVCRKLGGIALAIELAAGRVDAHGIEGVDTLLDGRLSLLWQGRRTAPPRHQTLNATLDWSYDLLAEAERAVLRRLAVFSGSFTLEAAQAIAHDYSTEPGGIAEVIANLVAKSLIVSETGGGRGARYRLLDTARTYLQAKLAGTDEIDRVAQRHAAFFRTLLVRDGPQVHSRSEACPLDAMGEHLGNIRAALEWSFADRGDVSLGVALVAAAAPLFLEMSLLIECRRWTETALATYAAAEAGPHCEMELQAALGLSLIHIEGNSSTVRDTLKRALDLAEGLGELGPQLRLIGALHMFHARIGDFRESVRLADRTLVLARAMDDPTGLAEAQWMLGISYHLAGDQTRALIHCRGALLRPAAGARAHGVRVGIDQRICAVCVLSRAQWLCGQVDEAVDTVHSALAEAEALEHPATLCTALFTTASLFLWIGHLSEVEAIVDRLISVAEKVSLGPYHTLALGLSGCLAVCRGEAAAAIPQLLGCVQTLRSRRHGALTSVFAGHLAEAMATVGRIDDALATIDEEISEAERRGGSFDMPEMWRIKGDILLNRNPSPAAAAEYCFRRSLDLAHRQGALSWELRTATAQARLRAGQGRREEAREELAAVFGRFTQGKETADLRAARNLLEAFA